MKTIITIITIMVFCFIVYRKKLAPLFKGNKKASHDAGNGTGNNNGTGTFDSGTSILPGTPLIPTPGLTCDTHMRYEVAVFDYSECETASTFSDYIQARLTVLSTQMAEKGYPYRVDFITIGTALIALVSYQV